MLVEPPIFIAWLTYCGYISLVAVGFINYYFFHPKHKLEKRRDGYVPLLSAFEVIYYHYIYQRAKDCANRVITSAPKAVTTFKNNIVANDGRSVKFDGTTRDCINLGSYNYLGFGQDKNPCTKDVVKTIETLGNSMCSTRNELGKIEI